MRQTEATDGQKRSRQRDMQDCVETFCLCAHQLTVEEERQENAKLLLLVQEMNMRILSTNMYMDVFNSTNTVVVKMRACVI